MPAPCKPARPERAKILITVKTYPIPSSAHTETVCTAGVTACGRWVRLYPIPYRLMDKASRFRKYQWIEAKIARDTRDPRPESYKLAGDIKPLAVIGTENAWEERKRLVLGKIYHSLETLVGEARDTTVFTSLAVFRPERITGFRVERDFSARSRERKRKALEQQLPEEHARQLAEAVPFRFYYTFIDQRGKRSTLQILDWEIYQLCRKLICKYGARREVLARHLRTKYLDQLTATREVYLFLGTNKHWHIRRSTNPFMIVGIFYPPAPKSRPRKRP